MKKFIGALAVLSAFSISTNAYAKNIDPSEVPNNSYVIGKYVFSEDITLTTKHIMIAAKTIEGNSLDDMVIYYKTPRGKWIEGATGETVETPTSFDVKYEDMELEDKVVATPTLSNVTLAACGSEPECQLYISQLEDGVYHYDLGINSNAYRSAIDGNISVSGYEIYEKNDTVYTKVGSGEIGKPEAIEVSVEPSESKVYVARVYALNSKGEKVYSEYSNEVVIDHSKLETPTLSNVTLAACGDEPECQSYIPQLENGVYHYDLGINSNAYRSVIDGNISVSGYEIYEKNDTVYAKVGSGEIGKPEAIEVSVELGESKVYVARVYALNSKEEKVYSEYSNEVVINHSKSETPTLSMPTRTKNYSQFSVTYEGRYKENGNLMNGWELYEKNGEEYTLVESKEDSTTIEVSLEPDENKVYVARAYVLNSKEEKVYSEYSNEVVNKVLVPTIEVVNDSKRCPMFGFVRSGNYKNGSGIDSISGWELYEKTGDEEYVLLNRDSVIIEPNETKVIVARVYALNSKGEKVYSEYSNEVTVTNEILAPILDEARMGTVGSAVLSIGNYENGYGSDSISGWELYEKTEDGEYILKEGYSTSVEPGETKVYVARVYALNSKGEKVYSEYSNEFIHDRSILVPTLSEMSGERDYPEFAIDYTGNYKYGNDSISGWELYEYKDGEYNLLEELEFEPDESTGLSIRVEPGESKIFVARVYALNRKEEKVYSEYSNEVIVTNEVLVPELTPVGGAYYGTGRQILFEIDRSGHYKDSYEIYSISGWELYEYKDGEYNLLEGNSISYEVNEIKVLVARVYKLNSKGEKIYSEYSNEVILASKISAPILIMPSGGPSEGIVLMGENVFMLSDYVDDYVADTAGWELYEKTEGGYKLLKAGEPDSEISAYIDFDVDKTLAARVYMFNSKGEKVYSEYSNEITVKGTIMTPTLDTPAGTKGSAMFTIAYSGNYEEGNFIDRISGWELYEKSGEEYILVESLESTATKEVSVELGESKVFVARVHVLNSDEEKVYSEYSNEVTLTNAPE